VLVATAATRPDITRRRHYDAGRGFERSVTQLYLFAAAAGVPLVLWFLLSGGDGGDEGGGAGDDGLLGVTFRLLPISTLAFAAATFGVCGLVLGLVDTDDGTTFIASGIAGVLAGAANSTAFAYLRRSESASDVSDRQLAGAVGRVVLPVAGERRGRVAVAVGGQQVYLSATTLPDAPAELEVGAPILVVEVTGGIATVTRLDTELT
jgi:membrane protein implicated in regulation of membrane protease activity